MVGGFGSQFCLILSIQLVAAVAAAGQYHSNTQLTGSPSTVAAPAFPLFSSSSVPATRLKQNVSGMHGGRSGERSQHSNPAFRYTNGKNRVAKKISIVVENLRGSDKIGTIS